jgi:AP-2 complex subunit alpha
VLHSSEGKFGCLLRLEPNFETQVRDDDDDDVDVGGNLSKLTMRQMYRITIRATDESVPPVLVKAMQDRLSQGIEGMA